MAVTETIATTDLEFARQLGQQLRVDSIRCSTAAGSGHPTSSMSAADLIAVLLTRYLQYDWSKPKDPNNDHLIYSKGHASPLCYAMFKAAGAITDAEMMTFRKFGSRLQGHPTPVIPWVDVATGSLGQGLPIGVGVALAGQYLDNLPYHVWVLCGDSELAEGSIWEALDKAGHYKLANLTAIWDINRLGQRGETEFGWSLDTYRRRVEAFGCYPIVIDGHDMPSIDRAFGEALSNTGKPTVIIAKTIKGKGFSEIENKDGWHGKPLPPDMAERAIKELGGIKNLKVKTQKPERGAVPKRPAAPEPVLPTYKKEDKVATRKAYGDALVALGAIPDVVAMDGEVSNSTHSDEFAKAFPDRFFEIYIAEQQLIATAVGMSVRGYRPFASTFACFLSRACDQIRVAGISMANLKLAGSHVGVSIGEDGPSQMGLEDLAMTCGQPNFTVLYPSDGVSAWHATRLACENKGPTYIRTTGPKTRVLYAPDEKFEVGKSKALRASTNDLVTVVGAGITMFEALAAFDELVKEGIPIRVIDLFSVQPIDVAALIDAANVTDGRIITVEDHYAHGGVGDAVLSALAAQSIFLRKLAVREIPRSGKQAELMDRYGISARHIVAEVKLLLAEDRDWLPKTA